MYESRNKREGHYAERNVRGHQTSKKWFANRRTRGLKSRRILDNAIVTRERANEQTKRARIVSDAFIGELLKNAAQVKVQLVESFSITRGTLGKYPKKKSAAIKGQFIGRKLKRRTLSKRRLRSGQPVFQYGLGVRKFAQRVLDNIKASRHVIVVDRPTSIVSGEEGAFIVKAKERSSQDAVRKILEAPLVDMTKKMIGGVKGRSVAKKMMFDTLRTVEKGALKGEHDDKQG